MLINNTGYYSYVIIVTYYIHTYIQPVSDIQPRPTGVKLIIGDSSCGQNMEDIHEEELQTKCQFLSMCQVAFQVLLDELV